MSKPTQSKRVKWVADANLCQVKLFLSDDCPSKIRNKAEGHVQTKTSSLLQCDGMGSEDLPPGFGGKGFLETTKQTCVPQINWKCPPMFILNNDWRVGAGKLSEEIVTQNCREMRVLEAVYPRPSAIPPSPSVLPGLEECDYDDLHTPLIPLIPIEEEDAVDNESPPCPIPVCSTNSVVMNQDDVAVRSSQHNPPDEFKVTINEKSIGISTGLEADTIAAASAAFTAIMKCNEQGSLIDTDLLVKILSDPKMVERLSRVSGASGGTKTPIYEELKPATATVPSPTKVNSTIFRNPLDETLTMHNVVQQKIEIASHTFLSSETTRVPKSPLSNVKPISPVQGDEISNQFGKDLSSNSSLPVSNSITTLKLHDINQLLHVLLSTLSSSGSKTANPSTVCASMSNKFNMERPMDRLELHKMVHHTSAALILGSVDTASASDLFSQPGANLLQNPTNVDQESSQFSSQTSLSVLKSTSCAPMALSSRSGYLLEDCRPNMVSSTEKDNQSLPLEVHSVRSYSQYFSSPSDRLISSSVSVKSPHVKDINYYKSLIKLHGSESQVSQGEHTHQYRFRASEVTEVSTEGRAKSKIQKACKFFNSSQGCRKGVSCSFNHVILPKLRARSIPEAHISKKLKLGRELN